MAEHSVTNLGANIQWQDISQLEGLFDLAAQWRQLADSCNSHLFNRLEWLRLWSTQFWDEHCQLHCLAGFVDGKLVVLVPFYIRRVGGLFKLRRLHFLGQGEPEQAELAAEYPELLVQHGFWTQAKTYITQWLASLRFDELWVRALIEGGRLHQLITEWPKYRETQSAAYSLSVANWNTKRLSRNARSKWRRGEKKLLQLEAEFKWLSHQEIEQYWPKLVSMHQARWQQLGQLGAFADSRFLLFHQQFRLHYPEQIAMSGVFVQQQAIALNYYLRGADSDYFYQSGWEPSYSECSPGFALHVWSILNSPAKRYDFMMGGRSQSYKAQFGCDEINLVTLHVIRSPGRRVLFKLVSNVL
ncbi:GNAT family N-acetyltransferase [Agarivorans sp.]|uniref:GNAT family N-acetyltransferase n=1 Tax=Agarivorans sp. TaxID=1872412 RepID=UPI003CFFD927